LALYVSSDFGVTWTVKDSLRIWIRVAMSSSGYDKNYEKIVRNITKEVVIDKMKL
jgi:hypothetical protein